MSFGSAEIIRCPAAIQVEALEVLSWRLPEPQRSWMVARLRGEAEDGSLDLSGLWVARRRERVVGALLAQVLAGRTAAIWPPEVSVERLGRIWGKTNLRNQVAADLVRHALAAFAESGVRVAQALIERNGKAQQASDLRRGGMPRVTDLLYLARASAGSSETILRPGVPPLVWSTYAAETDKLFRRMLDATYEGSMDMPELEGARSLDDVLASHSESGHFQPELWQIGQVPGEAEATAVLLMINRPDRNALEIAYLGLTPSARGRGLGRAAVAFALQLAHRRCGRVELAVDERNLPARRLYSATGFQPFDRRAVHLVTFDNRT
jgi:ribosomal protein S18 acetylase RimI-like enzyme